MSKGTVIQARGSNPGHLVQARGINPGHLVQVRDFEQKTRYSGSRRIAGIVTLAENRHFCSELSLFVTLVDRLRPRRPMFWQGLK